MPEFVVNPPRFDPYKNFKFRVKWDGKIVAGVSKASGLKRTTEVVEHREGTPITLERGVTHDSAFEDWANLVRRRGVGAGNEAALSSYRKDIVLEMLNEAGQLVLAYKIYRCWVSEFSALPDLDANATAVAIQSITLQNEGWERDTSVVEPKEP